ncbi:hypothetical protein [Pseudalkalibacillus salsuginis]|uniref:hypothetical protein n=1 Tax=Pseudalkalibacillus salsuginis TaxID=2910972 RepID=UPI001F2B4639|nr:hypothetical protein [Pseudalkalibacillus salsuginis]MCF6409571.1 hypothetical protein [Pseudalkalibacillus salsuginis]
MKKGLLLSTSIVIVCIFGYMLYNQDSNAEEISNVGGKLVSEEMMEDMSERNLKLVSFINETSNDTITKPISIELNIKNFPKQLLYIKVLPGKPVNTKDIEDHYSGIIKSARNKSILKKNEEVEIIILNEKGTKIN